MDITKIAQEIRKTLKAEFPACKFSVRVDRYSMGQSLTVSLMAAPFAAFADGSAEKVMLNSMSINFGRTRSGGTTFATGTT